MKARRTVVLLNGRARNRAAAQLQADIEAAFALLDYPVTIQLVKGRLDESVQRAVQDGFTTIVAAGGDGTVRTVAAGLAHYGGVRLGVIPAGTFNHFAKDLGLPLDIPGAAATIAANHTQSVDIGAVNGRFFINSVALGLHPTFVRHRQQHERSLGKWLAIPVALWRAIIGFRTWQFTLHIGRHHEALTTPFVFIGNNDYQVKQMGLPNRQELAGGKLYVYVLQCTSRRQLLWLVLRGLLGDPTNERYFRAYAADSCQIMAKQPMYATLDGELLSLKPPLDFTVHKGRLDVLAPPR
jgi:diacylglycerol kinase family enzyme